MAIRVFMQRLRVGEIAEEGVEPIEATDSRVVVPCTQVRPAEYMVEEFAAVEIFCECLRRGKANSITKGIVIVAFCDRAGNIRQASRTAATVMHEEVRLRGVRLQGNSRLLADTLVTDGMAVRSQENVAAGDGVVERLAHDLGIAGRVEAVIHIACAIFHRVITVVDRVFIMIREHRQAEIVVKTPHVFTQLKNARHVPVVQRRGRTPVIRKRMIFLQQPIRRQNRVTAITYLLRHPRPIIRPLRQAIVCAVSRVRQFFIKQLIVIAINILRRLRAANLIRAIAHSVVSVCVSVKVTPYSL